MGKEEVLANSTHNELVGSSKLSCDKPPSPTFTYDPLPTTDSIKGLFQLLIELNY